MKQAVHIERTRLISRLFGKSVFFVEGSFKCFQIFAKRAIEYFNTLDTSWDRREAEGEGEASWIHLCFYSLSDVLFIFFSGLHL